jgi:uncharacterized membrane protein YsdA (DUF1294 family)
MAVTHSYRSPQRAAAVPAAIIWGAVTLLVYVVTDWPFYLDWLIGGTVATFALFAYDKRQAGVGGRRVPEIVLQGLSLLGGVVGGWLGMLVLRHKTRHTSFWVVQWIATAIHALLAWRLLIAG